MLIMMRERSLSKRIQAIKDESKKYEQDKFRTKSPQATTAGDSSPQFFKRKSQTFDLPTDDNAPSNTGF